MPTYLTLTQLGDYARKLRKARGLTQQDVADRLGVSQSQISAVENVSRDFKTERARKMLVILGGTTIDRSRIQFPIIEASQEERDEVASKNRNRRENEQLPVIQTTDDPDLEPKN